MLSSPSCVETYVGTKRYWSVINWCNSNAMAKLAVLVVLSHMPRCKLAQQVLAACFFKKQTANNGDNHANTVDHAELCDIEWMSGIIIRGSQPVVCRAYYFDELCTSFASWVRQTTPHHPVAHRDMRLFIGHGGPRLQAHNMDQLGRVGNTIVVTAGDMVEHLDYQSAFGFIRSVGSWLVWSNLVGFGLVWLGLVGFGLVGFGWV